MPWLKNGERVRIPYAKDPWNEIVPGLYMGGHWCKDPGVIPRYENGYGTFPVDPGSEFDWVVSLYQRAGFGPDADVRHSVLQFEDTMKELDSGTLCHLHVLADDIYAQVRRGKKVLVRCRAGYNRSGLLVGMVLLRGGNDPDWVLDKIRSQRSEWALSNAYFAQVLDAEYEWLNAP